MSWRDIAEHVIHQVDQALPTDAPLADRVKAIDAAYPFGVRDHHPYKIWLDCRRKYLGRHGYQGSRMKAGGIDWGPLFEPNGDSHAK